MKTNEIYVDLTDEDMRVYFDDANIERMMESNCVTSSLTEDEREDLYNLLQKLNNRKGVVMYCDYAGYVEVDDDSGNYDEEYEDRIEEEEEENGRIRSKYGVLIQKLMQIRDGWGKYATENRITKEEADILLNIIEGK